MRPKRQYQPDDQQARNHPLRKNRGWSLHIVEDGPDLRLYDGIPPRKTAYLCPNCGTKGVLKEWIWSEKNFVDLTRSDKGVEIRVRLGRFRCPSPDCDPKTFTERTPELNDRHHLTSDLAAEIMADLRSNGTFYSVARKYRINEKTLRSLEEEFVASEDQRRRDEHALRLPAQMGMHRYRLGKKNCCLLAKIETERTVEVITSLKPQQIISTISDLFDQVERLKVELVAVPLSPSLREAAEMLFPQAKIIVAKDVVEALANDDLKAGVQIAAKQLGLNKLETLEAQELLCISPERLTKPETRKLEALLLKNEPLKGSYDRKRNVLRAYSTDDSKEKKECYERWREGLAKSSATKNQIALLYKEEWESAIVDGMNFKHSRYFSRIERLIRLLTRVGRGYSAERIRGRLLYGEGSLARSGTDIEAGVLRDSTYFQDEGSILQTLIERFETMLKLQELPPRTTDAFR